MPSPTHYYQPDDLAKFGELSRNRPELAEKFFEWYRAVFRDGALSAREKSLIALAVSHAVHVPVLHRRLQPRCSGKRRRSRPDDGSRSRGGSDSWRRLLVHGVQMRGHVEKVGM